MDLWNNENPIADQFDDIEIPRWIEQDISPSTVAAIVQGGCASGAYMPAVTYHQASKTMGEYGDEVLDYIQEIYGELPKPDANESWSGMACFYLSTAVETWALGVHDILSEKPDSEAA